MFGISISISIGEQPRDSGEVPESLGPELVTNGTFDVGTGWTDVYTSWTISGGVASSSATAWSELTQDLAIADPKNYRVSLDVSGYTGGNITVRLGGHATSKITITGNGNYSEVLECGAAGVKLQIFQDATAASFTIDNVSVKEVL